MASRSMALDVLVRLRDHLSGPLRGLRNNLRQLTDFARRIGVLGAAIAGISFMGPIQEAAAFQQQLIDIAGTAELAGDQAFAFVEQVKGQYEGLALEIGQYSETIAKGAGQMIAAGVDRSLIDATIGDIGRASTAANAEFADMASVGTSMLNNLKLPADQMRDSLGALVVAGKMGAFELKDMAAHFPQLTSETAKFGVKGREAVNFLASALQIARKGTSDPSTAANNLSNFLGKALAPVTMKNFRELGVDIEAVMMDAAAKGMNPIEAVIAKIGKLTNVSDQTIGKYMKEAKARGLEGADALAHVREQLEAIGAAGKIGELFQDKQVLDFLVPFLANVEEYKDIKASVAAATGAAIDDDFNTQIQGLNRQLAITKEIGSQAAREVGLAFGSWLPVLNPWLASALKWMRDLDASTGGMVKQFLVGSGAVLLVVAALGALGVVLPIIGAGLGAIGALVAALAGPVGVVVALLAGGAYLVAKNWDRVKPRLARVWDTVKRGAGQAWSSIKDGWNRLQPSLEAGWNGLQDAGARAWSGVTSGARSAMAGLKEIGRGLAPSLSDMGQNLKSAFSTFGDTFENLKRIGTALGGLARSLAELIGFGKGDRSAALQGIGRWLGSIGTLATKGIEIFAKSLATISGGLADLAEWANGGKRPDWVGTFPESAASTIKAIADGVGRLWSLLKETVQLPSLSWDTLSVGFERVRNTLVTGLQAIENMIKRVRDALPSLGSAGEGFKGMWNAAGALNRPPVPANSNNQSSLRPAVGSQDVNVGGTVRIQVDGPGKVTGTTSDNAKVPVTSTGRMVGRN